MDLSQKYVITVSREVGSGGRSIGRKLSERLGVRYCDKNIINALVNHFGLSAGSIERIKGEKKNWLTDALQRFSPDPHVGAAGMPRRDTVPNIRPDDLFELESEVLRKLADEGPCVIAGRSGFFILKDHPNKCDIFLRASLPYRIRRVMERQGKTEAEAAELIAQIDRMRENYIQRYTGVSRYDARNYDLVLNVDELGEDGAVELIWQYLHTPKH